MSKSDWPDPGQVQHSAPLGPVLHNAPLGVSQYQPGADDGAEFTPATGADIFKAAVDHSERDLWTMLSPADTKRLVEFVTSLNGAFAEALQIYKDCKEFMGRPGMTINPLHEAAPDMLAALNLYDQTYTKRYDYGSGPGPTVAEEIAVMDAVSAAIAKSEAK